MSIIQENVNLKPFNTFGIEARCRFFLELNSVEEFLALLNNEIYLKSKKLIIGGGSNILFTHDFEGIVIKNNLKGIEIVSEDQSSVIVKVAAGEIWHHFVMWCINRNFGGIENLSLIPGCVGASPMQNIGAYGVEIKQVFRELEAVELETGVTRIFSKEECKFGYRESVFKREYKDRYLITSVSFVLSKSPEVNTSYGAINNELRTMNISQPGIKDVSAAVIAIRRSKLPDPEEIGNAGSFFKNPEVSAEKYLTLKNEHNTLVAYALQNGDFKLAAGWLIEQSVPKGFSYEGAAVHLKQSLVLINKNNCKGKDVLFLSDLIIKRVFEKFGVKLEREVNIIE